MSPWIVAQAVFAVFAWYLAARAVARVCQFGGLAGRELAATVRELRRAGRPGETRRLPELLGIEPLARLFDLDADQVSAEELVAAARDLSAEMLPPLRVIRGLATIGTTLGLLAAVASLRTGLEASTTVGMEAAAGHAFDSAVAGFVTALPCWTAVSLCGRQARQNDTGLEQVLLALRGEVREADAAARDTTAKEPADAAVRGSESVDGEDANR